jgi:hypothetical protein
MGRYDSETTGQVGVVDVTGFEPDLVVVDVGVGVPERRLDAPAGWGSARRPRWSRGRLPQGSGAACRYARPEAAVIPSECA